MPIEIAAGAQWSDPAGTAPQDSTPVAAWLVEVEPNEFEVTADRGIATHAFVLDSGDIVIRPVSEVTPGGFYATLVPRANTVTFGGF